MKINGEFACVMCCFKFKNVLLYYQTGYDPKWINISALRILIYEVIESAIKNQTQIFDFGRGEEQYKLVWTKSIKQTKDVLVFKNKFVAKLFSKQNNLKFLLKSFLFRKNDK